MPAPLRITIWNEFRHERRHDHIRAIYPTGIHGTLADALRSLLPSSVVRTATLDDPHHGLTDTILADTDVLLWWGHMAHHEVADDLVNKVHQRVLEGMGALFLHSAHYSKPFKKLMGTDCGLRWREAGELERLYVVNPAHEISDGLPPYFEIPHEEMYGEFFDVPAPDELILLSWFEGGNVFRSCCTWTRGKGKIAYFRPGHESFPTYHHPMVQRVIANAAQWAAPRSNSPFALGAPMEHPSLNPIATKHQMDESLHKSS